MTEAWLWALSLGVEEDFPSDTIFYQAEGAQCY